MMQVVLVGLCVLALFPSAFGVSAAPYDFAGETVSIAFRMHDVTPLGPRGAYNWYEPDGRLMAHIESVEQMFNVNIEFVEPRWEWEVPDAIRTGVLTGDVPFDVAHLFSGPGAIPALAVEGFIYSLDTILDHDYWATLPPELQPMQYSYQILGSTYAFPVQGKYWDGPAGILWNKTLFEQEGLPNLYELYETGQWTWEAFRDISRLATQDTSGDGEIDQWGANLQQTMNWVAANQGQLSQVEDGHITLSLTSEPVLETWRFLHSLVDEGIANWGRDLTRVAMIDRYIHDLVNWTNMNHALVDGIEWGIVPYPKGPSADSYSVPEFGWVWGGVIPINTDKDPRALVELMNALQQITLPYIDDLAAWQEAYWEDRTNAVFDRESLEIWRWMDANTFLFPDPMVRQVLADVGWLSNKGGPVANRIIDEGQSAAVVMGEIQTQAQTILDEILGQ